MHVPQKSLIAILVCWFAWVVPTFGQFNTGPGGGTGGGVGSATNIPPPAWFFGSSTNQDLINAGDTNFVITIDVASRTNFAATSVWQTNELAGWYLAHASASLSFTNASEVTIELRTNNVAFTLNRSKAFISAANDGTRGPTNEVATGIGVMYLPAGASTTLALTYLDRVGQTNRGVIYRASLALVRVDGPVAGGGGGSGTVTSVGIASTTLSSSGGPITSSGNITVNIATNAITTQTEDQTPATNDFVLVSDTSTASLKRVALGNLPGGGGSYNDSNLVAATNALHARMTTAEGDIVSLQSNITTLDSSKQNADGDLDDLADGSLTGSKVGTGIDAGNITSGATSGTGHLVRSNAPALQDATLNGTTIATSIDAVSLDSGALTVTGVSELGNVFATVITATRYVGSVTNSGTNATVTRIWEGGAKLHRMSLSGNTTISVTNVPGLSATAESEIELEVANPSTTSDYTLALQLISDVALDYGVAGRLILLKGATNYYRLKHNGTNVAVFQHQVSTTGNGSGDFVLRTRTNYAHNSTLTFNVGTDLFASVTNPIGGNATYTLATPVKGTSFCINALSDGSVRTITLLCTAASMTWLKTNWTANSTNPLTVASKKIKIFGQVGEGTDGVSTNIDLWVFVQTP